MRFKKENDKRLAMVKELEEKERESSKVKAAEEQAAVQLERELRRLREKMAKEASTSQAPAASKPKQQADFLSAREKERTLKVTWRKTEGGDGEYTVAELREIFGNFGAEVQDVVVRDKGTKGAAIVVLGSRGACAKALGSVCGRLSNPLLVVPLVKTPAAAAPAAAAAAAATSARPNGAKVGGSFESEVLAKLRAAASAQKKRKRDLEGKPE